MPTLIDSLERNPQRFDCPYFEYNSLGDFLSSPRIHSGVNVVRHGRHYIDTQYVEEDSDTLLVIFNSAVPTTDRGMLPIFQFYHLMQSVRCSKLFISDPALMQSEDISSGWYTGASDLPLQAMLPKIIEKVATRPAFVSANGDQVQGKHKKVILFGSSAGAFAAMYFGSTIAGSLVLACAPQTNLIKHPPDFIDIFARHCFGANTRPEVEEVLRHKVESDLIPAYASSSDTKVIYLQNKSDWHVNVHLKPFLSGIGLPYTGCNSATPNLALVLGEWGEGHVFPPSAFIQWILNTASNYAAPKFAGFISDQLMSELAHRSKNTAA